MTAALIVLVGAVVVLLAVALHLARRGVPAASEEKTEAWAPAVPEPAANVAVVTLYELWMSRVEQEKLAARDDAWVDLTTTPQYPTWQRLAQACGAGGDVPRYMTHGLLAEVLYAAGGVEREFGELRQALDHGQQASGREPSRPAVLLRGEHAPASQRQPIGGAHAAAAARSVREASYSFVNLLSWARSTVERTDRPYQPGSSARAGLLPALRPGELHDSVEAALQHLRTALRDSRAVSSYAFHTGAVPGEVAGDGRTVPDAPGLAAPAHPLTGPALAGEALEFTEDRDKLTYATDLMAATEGFVNQVLDAFAAA